MAFTPTAVLEPVQVKPAAGSDFAQLSMRINAAGLMARRPGYYSAKVTLTVAGYLAAWVVFALVGPSWWQLAVGALLAFATTQLAFLGHDFGHRQIFRTRSPSEVAGLLLGNLGVGMSYGWWITKHTRHHANPNHEEHDPDVGIGALHWTAEQAQSRTGVMRLLARWQGWLFFPMLLLEGLSLHAAGITEIIKTPIRHRRWEAVLITAHIVIYLAVVFWLLPVGMAFAFIAVHQALFGFYMGASFAPNHKGMPIPSDDVEWDFLRKQVLTSRNVDGGPIVDFMLGGLNYQIEHHLFPSMPRANLRKAQPIVRAYCDELGVSYLSSGLVSSYVQAVGYLNEVGRSTRTA
jgi:fatty acid desaturase